MTDGDEATRKLPAGSTATDLVLTITAILRKHGVVEKFVEFFGDGVTTLSLADRATISNMAPEYAIQTLSDSEYRGALAQVTGISPHRTIRQTQEFFYRTLGFKTKLSDIRTIIFLMCEHISGGTEKQGAAIYMSKASTYVPSWKKYAH